MVPLDSLLPFIKPAAKWLASQAVAQGWQFFRRRKLARATTVAIGSALTELFRRLPELNRHDALRELGPVLKVELEKLPTPTEEPDPLAIGKILCRGAPVATPPVQVVGEIFLEILLERLLRIEQLQPILQLRMTYLLHLRVCQIGLSGQSNPLVSVAQNAVPLPPPKRAQAEAALSASAPTLLDWPQVLPSGEWVDRPELAQLRDRIRGNEPSVTVLLGSPGSGKSALLARLGTELREESEVTVIGIKADQLTVDIDDERKLAESQGLDGEFSTVVLRLAKDRPVVLLVDQMDAVADIVDLTSRRLSILLDVIARLGGTPNIHIIASSRSFEFKHDPRFDRIKAQPLTLQPPTWDTISSILTQAGVNANHWPTDRKNAMRLPQVLSTFLALAGDLGDVEKVAASYHGMLDQVWAIRLNKPSVRSFITDLAQQMAEDESLYQPCMRWHRQQVELEEALASGVLLRSHDGLRLSFRHQTLFDHAVAHAFIQVGTSISQYVADHQDTLFSRPRIWSVLTYMRDAAPDLYTRELDAIWSQPGLRLHVRYLLLELMGAQEDPSVQEVALLLPCLDDPDLVMKAARAIAGNRAWFDVVRHGLADMMRVEGRRRDAFVHLARAALPFDRASVFQLMDRHWASDEDVPMRFNLLSALKEWDDEAVRLVAPMARNERIGDSAICWLATTMGVCRPDDAGRLCLDRLKWRLNSLGDGVGDLVNGHDWAELAAVSEACPDTFLEEGLPWFLDLMERCVWPSSSNGKDFRHSQILLPFTNEPGLLHQSGVVAAVMAALSACAATDTDQFLRLSAPLRGCDIDLVQRMFARSLELVARTRPELATEYLLDDKRRLRLGVYDAEHLESRRLIAAIANTGDVAAIDRLFQGIMDWTQQSPEWSEDNVDWRRQWLKSIQAEKVQLLRAFPLTALNDAQRQKRLAEERLCPNLFPEHNSDAGKLLSPISSQMSADAMRKASEDDVIAFLQKHLVAPTEADHRALRDRHTFTQEFAEFAKKEPVRAAAIIDRLPVEGFEDLLRSAVWGIADGFPFQDFLSWFKAQLARGHGGRDFIESTALAVRGLVKHPFGLPDDILAVFASTLHDADEPRPAIERRTPQPQAPPRSILWGVGGGVIVPQGNYPLLSAIWYGYLLREPAEADLALKIALDHLLQHRELAEVWTFFAGLELNQLRYCSQELAVHFIDTLLARLPAVAASAGATIMVAYTWVWAPVEDYLRWASAIRQTEWDRRGLAYGELVGLRHLLQPEDERLRQEAERVIAGGEASEQTGLAFAATNLWNEATTRVDAASLLARLAMIDHPEVSAAVLDAFRTADPLPSDQASRLVLDAVATRGVLARVPAGYFLIRGLADVVTVWPEQVAAAAEAIVRTAGAALGDTRTSWASNAHELISVSLALQRLGGRWRAEGLAIFEALLQAEAYGIDDVLADLEGPRRGEFNTQVPRLYRRRGSKQ